MQRSHTPVLVGTVPDCRVDVCPDGPALVRGAETVETDSGVHDVTRPVVAVCLCGLTQRAPWCDATHKVAARTDR